METQTATSAQTASSAHHPSTTLAAAAVQYAPQPRLEIWCGVPVFVWGNEAEWEAVQPIEAA